MSRVAEDFNISVSFEPKLFKEYNGAGCHVNYSTKSMREGKGGMEYITDMIRKLAAKHKEHIELYGDNTRRLTGRHETSSMEKFTYGVGDRSASVRIPTSTAKEQKGYIEDRRPASNIDPYVVSAMLVDTSLIEESMARDLIGHYRKWSEWIKT